MYSLFLLENTDFHGIFAICKYFGKRIKKGDVSPTLARSFQEYLSRSSDRGQSGTRAYEAEKIVCEVTRIKWGDLKKGSNAAKKNGFRGTWQLSEA